MRLKIGIVIVMMLLQIGGGASTVLDSLIARGEQLAISNIDSSRYFLSKALALSKKENSSDSLREEKEIKCLALLGDSYSGQSDFSAGISFYVAAIKKAEAKGRPDLAAKSYNGLGVIAYQRGDFKKAEQYFLHAAKLKLDAGLVSHYAMIMTNLSGVFFSVGKYDEALKNLHKALPELVGNDNVLAAAYNSIGGIYQLGYQKLDSAQFYYDKSIEISEKGNFKDVLISAYHNQGEIFIQQKKFDAGIPLLQKSVAICKELKKDAYTITVLNSLSEAYSKMGNYELALKTKNEAFEISQTLNSSEKQEAIERLQIQFEAEKKSAEIAKKNEALLQSELRYEVLKNRYVLFIGISLLLVLAAFAAYAYVMQKRKAERQLEKERNRIFQNVVHEIRTPLTLIGGPLRIIQESGDLNQLQQQLPIIERNSQRLLKMVNDILYLSKLESGAFNPAYEVGDPILFVKELSSTFFDAFGQNQQKFEFKSSEGDLCAFPKDVVEACVTNLLSNALKYAGAGSRVQLEVSIVSKNLNIYVRDTGRGINTADSKKIFQRFYRGSNASAPSGSGIGLALVSEAVQAVGGRIVFKPNVPSGAVFHVSLPLRSSQTINSSSDVQSGFVLLLVEDDADLSSFVQSLFEEQVQVITAFSVKDAMELTNKLTPDIILTDIMLPDGSGLDFLRWIKSNPDSAHIPVTVFSARSNAETRLDALKAGASAYFSKPFQPTELKQAILNVISEIVRIREYNSERLIAEKVEPNEPPTDPFIQKCIDAIHKELDNGEFGPEELGNSIGISRSQLHRKLVSLTGQSASNFIRMVRLKKAKDFLSESKYSIKEIAYMCGFNSPGYFSKSYKELFGHSPGDEADSQ
jgi:signal transduction histidine kinase/DNA-binding NarL/FixJ family response regulator